MTLAQSSFLSGFVSLDWVLCSDFYFAVCVACLAFPTWINILHHIYFSKLLCPFRFQDSGQFHNLLELLALAFSGLIPKAGKAALLGILRVVSIGLQAFGLQNWAIDCRGVFFFIIFDITSFAFPLPPNAGVFQSAALDPPFLLYTAFMGHANHFSVS